MQSVNAILAFTLQIYGQEKNLGKNKLFFKNPLTNALCCGIISMLFRKKHTGVWLSLVERLVRDQEVGCSNHLTPTIRFQGFLQSFRICKKSWFYACFRLFGLISCRAEKPFFSCKRVGIVYSVYEKNGRVTPAVTFISAHSPRQPDCFPLRLLPIEFASPRRTTSKRSLHKARWINRKFFKSFR